MLRSPRFLLVLVSTLFVGLTGCTPVSEPVTYQGRAITISYQNADSLVAGEWLEIDGMRFYHVADLRTGDSTTFPLPTTYVVVDSLPNERAIGSRVEPSLVAIQLARHLADINALRPDSAQYLVGGRALITLQGTVQLSRRDSVLVTVTASPGYGAAIEVME